ncbi:MAG: HAMP domain-containing histidine kinase [Bacteroidetes bacterium]|nr:HAMP domain-containing histidine kinase [Bacteroidota bacterium]
MPNATMVTKSRFWDFLIDPSKPLPRSVYKKSILRGQLSILSILVGITYIVIDSVNGVYLNIYYYAFLIVASLITLVLNKQNKPLAANITFLVLMNLLVFVFASSDTYRSGVYTFFIVSSITGLTLCGYEQLKLGLFFVGVSVFLFVLAYVFKYSPVLPRADFSETYITLYFTANFVVSILVVSTLLYFLIEINHHTENELIQNNELLVKTNQELDRFVYSASHDLRSPLSSILGLVEIAKKSKDPEEINMCLNLIQDRVKVQDSFIYEIIEYARNNRMNIHEELINLKLLIFEVIDQLVYMQGASEVDIQVIIDENTFIHTDKARLTSVLTNLIGNAIKYQDKMKTNRFVRIGLLKSATHLSITVEDNGQGIQPKFQERIFDMFFRASENSKGSGLGLFIVKETTSKLGGTVSLQSEYGKGSIFTVSLPIQQPLNLA